MSISTNITMVFLLVLGYLVTPVMLIWGWARWTRSPKPKTFTFILSLSAFVLATCSALLAVSTHVYAHFHPFDFYDPVLMRIYRWGTVLSLGAVLFAIGGIWRNSSLRWHAFVCALGTLSLWVMAAASE
jgi:hypothetical protein